jgi:hypothetical protein
MTTLCTSAGFSAEQKVYPQPETEKYIVKSIWKKLIKGNSESDIKKQAPHQTAKCLVRVPCNKELLVPWVLR